MWSHSIHLFERAASFIKKPLWSYRRLYLYIFLYKVNSTILVFPTL